MSKSSCKSKKDGSAFKTISLEPFHIHDWLLQDLKRNVEQALEKAKHCINSYRRLRLRVGWNEASGSNAKTYWRQRKHIHTIICFNSNLLSKQSLNSHRSPCLSLKAMCENFYNTLLLPGLYQHNTAVVNNSISGNCASEIWQNGPERKTFGNYLKQDGYLTFYAGKYLNEYGNKQVGGLKHVPPGWDFWAGLQGKLFIINNVPIILSKLFKAIQSITTMRCPSTARKRNMAKHTKKTISPT